MLEQTSFGTAEEKYGVQTKKSQHKLESTGKAQEFNLTRCQVHACTESLAQFPGIS